MDTSHKFSLLYIIYICSIIRYHTSSLKHRDSGPGFMINITPVHDMKFVSLSCDVSCLQVSFEICIMIFTVALESLFTSASLERLKSMQSLWLQVAARLNQDI